MKPQAISRSGSESLRVPLAASLLLHAALLGLLALALPRALPEPGGTVEVRLVSLEAEEGAGAGMGEVGAGRPAEARRPLPGGGVDRTAGAIARETLAAGSPPEPAASPAPSVEPPAGEPPRAGAEPPAAAATPAAPAPTATPPAALSAPPPPASVAARVVSQAPMAVGGPKASAPDPPLGTPSGFEVPQGPPVTEGALPGQGPAAARSATAGPGGAVGAPDGGRGAEQEGGGAGWTGGPLARGREGFRGTGDGTDGPGGVGTSGLGSGTGRDGAFAYILRRIEAAKHYPEDARRLGHRGTVAVRFRIGPDGAVASAEVAASSGSSLLDVASLETVRRAAPLPAVPGWLRVRISYGLAEARP